MRLLSVTGIPIIVDGSSSQTCGNEEREGGCYNAEPKTRTAASDDHNGWMLWVEVEEI